MLQGTSLHAVTVQWKAQVDSDFGELEELQLSSPAEDGCSTARDALGGFLTKEGYLWALGTVRCCAGRQKARHIEDKLLTLDDVFCKKAAPCAVWDFCRLVGCPVWYHLGGEYYLFRRRHPAEMDVLFSPIRIASPSFPPETPLCVARIHVPTVNPTTTYPRR